MALNFLARLFLLAIFFVSGVHKLQDPKGTASMCFLCFLQKYALILLFLEYMERYGLRVGNYNQEFAHVVGLFEIVTAFFVFVGFHRLVEFC